MIQTESTPNPNSLKFLSENIISAIGTEEFQKDKAKDLFKQYHNRVPFVKTLMDSVMRKASNNGRVRTWLGRRCRFDLWEPNQYGIHKALPHEDALAEHGPGIRRAYTYKALNRLIQGSAADMTKKAMVELHKEGINFSETVLSCMNITASLLIIILIPLTFLILAKYTKNPKRTNIKKN